jgi:hypothetical protein
MRATFSIDAERPTDHATLVLSNGAAWFGGCQEVKMCTY